MRKRHRLRPHAIEPAAGAALIQPITLRWGAVVDPDGPIGNYTWQVGTSSSFGTIVLSGFTQQSLPGIPVPTQDRISGLPLGTYFWRVKATQMVGGAVFAIDSPWSTVRSFTVAALGSEPDTPSFTAPATGTQIHVSEFFTISWTPVADALYYLLEADDQPSFSHPLAFTGAEAMQFGTKFRAGWGNAIPNIYYRVRAVSADGVRGLPSPTLNVKITNAAPVPPAPTLLSPVGGAAVAIPFTFDWTDTPNPQDAGYDLDIDDEPNFQGTFGVFLVQNVSRSEYMLTETLAPGTYFWRVRAVHGQVRGPWSAGASFTLTAPSTPPGLQVLSIVPAPSALYGGNSTQARVTLNMPAPAGGVVVRVASDFAQATTPTSVVIPAGATDAVVAPITSVPVSGASVGTIRAALGLSWQMSSLAVFPLFWGVQLSEESVIGGDVVTGTVTLLNPAPPGGVTVTLASGNTTLLTPPPTVFIPAGGTGATFNVATSPVSAPTRVILDSGTGFEDYRGFSLWLTLMPPGSPEPRSEPVDRDSRLAERGRRRQDDGDGHADRARAVRWRHRPPERQHGGTGRRAAQCDRAGRQHQRQFHDHRATSARPVLRADSGQLRRTSDPSRDAAHHHSGLRRHDASGDGREPERGRRRHVDDGNRATRGAGASRRRSGDADQRQSVARPGAAEYFRSSRQQLDQLHDHDEPRGHLYDGAHRCERWRRDEVGLHQPGCEPERACPVVGDARRRQRDRRHERRRHRGPERRGAGRRNVGGALDQQFVGGASAAGGHRAGGPKPGHASR